MFKELVKIICRGNLDQKIILRDFLTKQDLFCGTFGDLLNSEIIDHPFILVEVTINYSDLQTDILTDKGKIFSVI